MIGCLSFSNPSVHYSIPSGKSCAAICPAGRTALVVDDNPIVLGCTADMLRAMGFDTHAAGEGGAAIGCLKNSAYDLILTDFAMPRPDGYQFGRNAKALRPETRVVVMTGHCQAAVAQLMDEHTVDGWLFKPFRIQHLKEMLVSLGLPVAAAFKTGTGKPMAN